MYGHYFFFFYRNRIASNPVPQVLSVLISTTEYYHPYKPATEHHDQAVSILAARLVRGGANDGWTKAKKKA